MNEDDLFGGALTPEKPKSKSATAKERRINRSRTVGIQTDDGGRPLTDDGGRLLMKDEK